MGFWDYTPAAIISGVNGAVGGYMNMQSQREANEANAALWREQAAYNTPTNQRARLEAAGMNPNLAYGTIAESKMANAPTMQSVRSGDILKGGLENYFNIRNQTAQLEVIEAQADSQRQQANESRARTAAVLEDVKSKAYENSLLIGSGGSRYDPSWVRAVLMRSKQLSNDIRAFYDSALDTGRMWTSNLKGLYTGMEKPRPLQVKSHK